MTNRKIKRVNMSELSCVIIDSIDNNSDVRLTVTGNSMYPLFRCGGDSVILTSNTTIKKYDIPLYKRENGEFVLHRVVKIKDDCLYLAGDNQVNIEYPIYPHQVIATVKGFHRNGKYVSCTNIFYRLYSFFWVLILPHRYTVLRILKKIKSILQKVRRKCRGK